MMRYRGSPAGPLMRIDSSQGGGIAKCFLLCCQPQRSSQLSISAAVPLSLLGIPEDGELSSSRLSTDTKSRQVPQFEYQITIATTIQKSNHDWHYNSDTKSRQVPQFEYQITKATTIQKSNHDWYCNSDIKSRQVKQFEYQITKATTINDSKIKSRLATTIEISRQNTTIESNHARLETIRIPNHKSYNNSEIK
ncbi:hypothetical protein CDAR_269681 [Caerostris darwini]|uniref:Uncharacterized protein n=1 Tax=Caerostris darwini TaxID=1538125 RepID=A0AAV4SM34_9ARAC|nr:hypothetical protein CDAR_269681 [Caerostris darwini]